MKISGDTSGRPVACPIAAGQRPAPQKLLPFNSCASVDKLLLDGSRFVLADTFLDGLRSAVHQVLGFLETQAGDFANRLDDVDLVGSGSHEDDVELRLFFSRG